MAKNPLMGIKKTSELIREIEQRGYTQSNGNGSSHLIYRESGHPTLSIPNTREISPGTLRNVVKLIEGDNYYNRSS